MARYYHIAGNYYQGKLGQGGNSWTFNSVNPMTASEAISAGADMLVAGSAVFSGKNYAKNIMALR